MPESPLFIPRQLSYRKSLYLPKYKDAKMLFLSLFVAGDIIGFTLYYAFSPPFYFSLLGFCIAFVVAGLLTFLLLQLNHSTEHTIVSIKIEDTVSIPARVLIKYKKKTGLIKNEAIVFPCNGLGITKKDNMLIFQGELDGKSLLFEVYIEDWEEKDFNSLIDALKARGARAELTL